MDWTSELTGLKQELEPLRLERERQAGIDAAERQERLAEIKKTFDSLHIEGLLGEMNRILLVGQGTIEVYTPWDIEGSSAGGEEEDEEEEEDHDEGEDAMSAVLAWDEGGALEIAVDVGEGRDGFYLQVNGVDIRLEEDAIQQALLRAFREELGL